MMKKIFTIVLALTLISLGAAKAQNISANPNQNVVPTFIKPESNPKALTMITQSTTQTIVTGNSVSCNAGGIHKDNSYYRVFDLTNNFGISTIWYVYKVDVAIEQASGSGSTQPVSVRLYSASSTNLTSATLTLIQEQQFDLDNSAASVVVPFTFTTPVEIPAGTILAVEFFTPDGTTASNSVFIGSNTDTENSPSYMKAADCSITVPTTTSAIGFPGMHIVMNVWGDISVGINNIDAKQIKIYPCPTKGIVNIENVSNANIYFSDVLGNVIATKENVTGNASFDLSNNAKGVYMVKIVSDNKIITKKIVNN